MGTEGMKYSLVSREVIADSIETVVGCEGFDGFVAIGGCDKNMPGCLMAMARLNRPAVFVYGGTILPGLHHGIKNVDIVSVFEAVGQHANGKMTTQDLQSIEACAIPGPGSCGGMYTANTMACAIEALGMSLPNSSAQAAISKEKARTAERAGAAVVNLLESGIRPRDIMTRKAFENAITVVIALGGSTNAVLHLLAMAHAAGVKLTHRRLHAHRQTRAGARRSQAERQILMAELVAIGGTAAADEDAARRRVCCTAIASPSPARPSRKISPTRRTVSRTARTSSVRFDNPIKKDSHLVILYGNLAPNGAVAKITGKEGLHFSGQSARVRVRGSRAAAILDGAIKKGDVIVIRYEGPEGGPGMREMLSPTARHHGQGPRARTSRSSPTDVSPAAATASSSATSRPKPRSAARSPW